MSTKTTLLSAVPLLLAGAVSSATGGCGTMPNLPTNKFSRPELALNSTTQGSSMVEVQQLCAARHRQIWDCLNKDVVLAARFVQAHSDRIPALKNGQIPTCDWPELSEEEINSLIASRPGLQLERESNQVKAILYKNHRFIYTPSFPQRLLSLALSKIDRFLKNMDKSSEKPESIEVRNFHCFTYHSRPVSTQPGSHRAQPQTTASSPKKISCIPYASGDIALESGDKVILKESSGERTIHQVKATWKQNSVFTFLNEKTFLGITIQINDSDPITSIHTFYSPVFIDAPHYGSKDMIYSSSGYHIDSNYNRGNGFLGSDFNLYSGSDPFGNGSDNPPAFSSHIYVDAGNRLYKIEHPIGNLYQDPDQKEPFLIHFSKPQPAQDKIPAMVFPDNSIVYQPAEQKKHHPNLSAESYIKLLAAKIKNHLNWTSLFSVWSKKSRADKARDKGPYQNPETAVNENLVGNDGDFAFFAKEILRQQGVNSQVMDVPGFGPVTFWLTGSPDGKYDINYVMLNLVGKNGFTFTFPVLENFEINKRGFVPVVINENLALNTHDKVNQGFADFNEIIRTCVSVGRKIGFKLPSDSKIDFYLKNIWNGKIPVLQLDGKETKVHYTTFLNQ